MDAIQLLQLVVTLSPLLMLAAKIGIAFATWSLLSALVKLVRGATRYVENRE